MFMYEFGMIMFCMNGLHTAYLNMMVIFPIEDAYMGVLYGKAYVENGYQKHIYVSNEIGWCAHNIDTAYSRLNNEQF